MHYHKRNPLLRTRPQVRYTCLRDTKENLVASVREFPTCNYVALVSTPLLCKHPAFAPQVRSARARGARRSGPKARGRACWAARTRDAPA